MITVGTQVKHLNYGKGKVVKVEDMLYKIDFGSKGVIDISKRSAEEMLDVIESYEEETASVPDDVKSLEKMIRKIIDSYSDIQQVVELGDKWHGGKLIFQPANTALKPKEIPVETFFHKIVMVRDRLRVLEQNINSNTKLSDEEKVNIQQYITRIYGSLTSFNILFKNPNDQFVGGKKD